MPDIPSIIYEQARAGTPNNPGLPDPVSKNLVYQAAHETANFTSNFFRNYNNAFGYSCSGSVYQSKCGTQADNNLPIAAYDSVNDSVKELVDYLYRRKAEGYFKTWNDIADPAAYASMLKRAGYYGDNLTNYTAGLIRAKNSVMIKTGIAISGVIVISVISYLMIKKFGNKR